MKTYKAEFAECTILKRRASFEFKGIEISCMQFNHSGKIVVHVVTHQGEKINTFRHDFNGELNILAGAFTYTVKMVGNSITIETRRKLQVAWIGERLVYRPNEIAELIVS